MPDREKVIKGLECCLSNKYPPCGKCGYDGDIRYNDAWSCRLSLMADALALLKAQALMIDALMRDLKKSSPCSCCANWYKCDPDDDGEKQRLWASCGGSSKLKWEWQGIEEVREDAKAD